MSQGIDVTVKDIYDWELRNASISGGGGSCVTDTSGCSYATAAGSFTVYASHTGYISESQGVSVAPNDWVDVYFDAAHGHAMYSSIIGIVHDESDSPLSDIFVWGQGTLGNTKSWGCFTNSDGNYSLPIHSAGDYVIYCGKNNYNAVSHGEYYQSSAYPTSTTTFDFTSEYAAEHVDTTSSKLAVYNRSVVIPDDLSDVYWYNSDEPNTNTVFAKTKILTGTYLNTYITASDFEEVLDGYGGSIYE